MEELENITNLPIWLLLILPVLAALVGMLIPRTFYALMYFLGKYPLVVLEGEHPECRATWLTHGVLLTSRTTGRAVLEIPPSTVRSVLFKRGGLRGRICLRFNRHSGLAGGALVN